MRRVPPRLLLILLGLGLVAFPARASLGEQPASGPVAQQSTACPKNSFHDRRAGRIICVKDPSGFAPVSGNYELSGVVSGRLPVRVQADFPRARGTGVDVPELLVKLQCSDGTRGAVRTLPGLASRTGRGFKRTVGSQVLTGRFTSHTTLKGTIRFPMSDCSNAPVSFTAKLSKRYVIRH